MIARFGGALGIQKSVALLHPPWQDRKAAITLTSFKKPPRFGKAYPRIIHLWTAQSQGCGDNNGSVPEGEWISAGVRRYGGFLFLVGLYEMGTLRFKELDTWLRQHAVLANPLN